MVKRKGWCISHARILNFWQIHLVNPDEVLYEVATWDLLLKVATSAEGAVGECVPAAMHSPELTQLILVRPTSSGMGSIALCPGQSFTTWKPSLTLLALTFPYTIVLDSKECRWFNAVSDGLNSLWEVANLQTKGAPAKWQKQTEEG